MEEKHIQDLGVFFNGKRLLDKELQERIIKVVKERNEGYSKIGGMSEIFFVTVDGTDYVVKKFRKSKAKERNQKDIFCNFNDYYNQLRKKFSFNEIVSLQYFQKISGIIGGDETYSIQLKIPGVDGKETILGGIDLYKTPNGFPNNVIDPLKILLQLSLELSFLHELGFVHSDVKMKNYMVSYDSTAVGEPPSIHCSLIDFDGMVLIGQPISTNSWNGAPEWRRLFERKKKLKEMLQLIKEELQVVEIQLKKKKSTPSYDVYSLGTMIPAILCGLFGKEVSDKDLNFSKHLISAEEYYQTIIRYAEEENFDEMVEYWEKRYVELNEGYEDEQGYSRAVIHKLSILTAKMLHPIPKNRPSMKEVVKQFEELLII